MMILSLEENKSCVVRAMVRVTKLPIVEVVEEVNICRLFGEAEEMYNVPVWKSVL
jgi:hypothetical protein